MQLKTTLLAAAIVAAGLAVQPFQTAQAGSATPANMTVQITIQDACDITTAPSTMDFGTAGPLLTNVDSTATFGVTCTESLPYHVGLDAGLNATGDITARKMADGNGNYVSYQLYTTSGRSAVWGNTANTDTVDFTGTGTEDPFTVYGRVAPQTTPPAGAYTDTVAVTVTF